MTIKYFKRRLVNPQKENNGTPKLYETDMVLFRINSEWTVDYLNPRSFKDYLDVGWQTSDGWEFGALNNGVSIDEWKKIQSDQWKNRDK